MSYQCTYTVKTYFKALKSYLNAQKDTATWKKSIQTPEIQFWRFSIYTHHSPFYYTLCKMKSRYSVSVMFIPW